MCVSKLFGITKNNLLKDVKNRDILCIKLLN